MKDLSLTPCALIDAPDLQAQVADLVTDLTARTGISPLSEQFLLGLSDPRLNHQHWVAQQNGQVVGVLALDTNPEVPVAELAARDGVAAVLLSGVSERPLDVWSHGPSEVAALSGAEHVRELWVMSLDTSIAEVAVPDGYEMLTLAQSRERWGSMVDAEFVRVNNEAFSWHPEQGGWDMARWERAQEAEWFDPAGVFLLWAATSVPGETGTLRGFHWTKCQTSQSVNGGRQIGEVYVVGLADAARGKGLGKPLTVTGVAHLQENGCDQVILYVEADNRPAVAVYEKLGFSVTESHVLYRFI